MAGVPPFIGFFAKLFVLFSAISISEYFIAIIAIIVSVISAYYYLRIIKVLYTEDNKESNSDSCSPSEEGEAGSLRTSLYSSPSLYYLGDKSVQPAAQELSLLQETIERRTTFAHVHILTDLHSLVIAVLSLFLVLFFLNPVLILTSTRVLSLSLFNF
jgi:NADH-ubiquinone oxidoreductase chain 2